MNLQYLKKFFQNNFNFEIFLVIILLLIGVCACFLACIFGKSVFEEIDIDDINVKLEVNVDFED